MTFFRKTCVLTLENESKCSHCWGRNSTSPSSRLSRCLCWLPPKFRFFCARFLRQSPVENSSSLLFIHIEISFGKRVGPNYGCGIKFCVCGGVERCVEWDGSGFLCEAGFGGCMVATSGIPPVRNKSGSLLEAGLSDVVFLAMCTWVLWEYFFCRCVVVSLGCHF